MSSPMWRLCCRIPVRCYAIAILLSLQLCLAQTDDVLCRAGSGKFGADFHGISVSVGASRTDGLATRSCDATLSWGSQQIVVAAGAFEIDLDLFGVDLGIGAPVAAFQVKKSESDCCRTYLIYSLDKTPRLLRTLTGAAKYSASDAGLDTRVEIWADDAAALDGFESFALSEMDSLPPVILRFEQNQLVDVGSEFQPYFDQWIAKIRAGLDPRDLQDFKNSDGKLKLRPDFPAERMHRLRRAKIAVLEIAWAYLNSGREADGWRALTEMWPTADLDRMRAAIVEARGRGVRSQIDSLVAPPGQKRKRAEIFDLTVENHELSIVPPQPILARWPPQAIGQSLTTAEVALDLVVDAAGKVRSAEAAGEARGIDPEILKAALEWKFIPAFRDGHAAASRMRMAFSLRK